MRDGINKRFGLRSSHPQRHPDRFSCFCTSVSNRQTDRQTHRPRCICSNRPHLMLYIAMRHKTLAKPHATPSTQALATKSHRAALSHAVLLQAPVWTAVQQSRMRLCRNVRLCRMCLCGQGLKQHVHLYPADMLFSTYCLV